MLSKTIVILHRPREPFEIAVLVLCLLAGLTELIYGPTPGSATAYMPLAKYVWLALMTAGSVSALAGVLLYHRALNGMVMEAVGLAALAVGIGLNGVAILVLTVTGDISTRGIASAPLAVVWAWAAWVRHRRVRREICQLEHAARDTEPEADE